jgi:hypothetical protein
VQAKKGAMNMEAQPLLNASVACGPWTTRYEDLRRHVLDGCAANSHWGVALFIRQGLAAWMEAWPKCTVPAPPNEPLISQHIADPPSLPSDLRSQITSVLVNMVLGGQQEVFA